LSAPKAIEEPVGSEETASKTQSSRAKVYRHGDIKRAQRENTCLNLAYNLADGADGTMMTRTVGMVPPLTVGEPEQLFKLKGSASLLEVSRNRRFLLLVHQVRAGQHPIAVWTAAIASTRR
jgi:hypothetical protein